MTVLLQSGDPVLGLSYPDGITSIRSTRATAGGGFAAMVSFDPPYNPVAPIHPADAVWGVHPGTLEPEVLVYTRHLLWASDTGLDQIRFEDAFGYSPQGGVAYSALVPVGECSPMHTGPGFLDSVWVGQTVLGIQGNFVYPGQELRYLSQSRPGLTADGRAFWHASAMPQNGDVSQWEGLLIESGGGVIPWVHTGVPAHASTIRDIGPFAVSTLGSYALCTARLDDGGEGLVRATWDGNAQPLVGPVNFGGLPVRQGGPVIAANALAGETWKRFMHLGAGESAEPGAPSYWFVLAETAVGTQRHHAVVISNGALNYVDCRSGDIFDNNDGTGSRTLLGRPEHVASNPQGDLASVWRVDPGNKAALFVNGYRLIETGETVPLRDGPGGPPISGTLTNIVGVNTVSLSGRSAGGLVSVYLIGNVRPHDQPDDLKRVQALFRIDHTVSTGTICTADWTLDGLVNSADISAYLDDWLADVNASPPTTYADFNNDGVTSGADTSAFLTAWLVGAGGGC